MYDPLFAKENVGVTEKIGVKTNVVLRDMVDMFNCAENVDLTSDDDENRDVTIAELELGDKVDLAVVYREYDEVGDGISSLADDVLVFSREVLENIEDKIGKLTLLQLPEMSILELVYDGLVDKIIDVLLM